MHEQLTTPSPSVEGATGPTTPTPHELFSQWRGHARRGEMSAAWQKSDQALELFRNGGLSGIPQHLQPVWDGTPVEGRDVLVRCRHGLGDTIQFSRFIPRLRELAASVTICMQAQLVDLLSGICEGAELFPADVVPHTGYDLLIEIMELAHVFRIGLNEVQMSAPYITAPPIGFESDAPLRVGIVWQASEWDDRRSIRFASVIPWAGVPGVELFSLQKDASAAGWNSDRIPSLDACTIERTAGLMSSLDLIITVDTMTAHLAGALGRPVWTLLQADADWRWLQHRDNSPWYPTMRLFRQSRPGDWSTVISGITRELQKLVAHAN